MLFKTFSYLVIDCGPVENTGNTQYEYVGGQKYNNIVKYSCTAGQCLEGSSVRRCQANGKWSDIAPKCICKLKIVFGDDVKREFFLV